MRMRILFGTDIILGYLLNEEYSDGVAIVQHWARRLDALQLLDVGTISISTHFVKTYQLSRLKGFDVIKDMPPLSPMFKTMLSQKDFWPREDERALLMQLNLIRTKKADVLITENQRTHDLARLFYMDDKIYTMEEFIETCSTENREKDDSKGIVLKEVPFGSLSLEDPFFNTFKREYAPYYFEWYNKKRDDIVYAAKDEKGGIKALLKLKIEKENEDYSTISPVFPPAKRLKICSLKVEYTGQKIGERFMRIIFDQALKNKVDEIYVTVFANNSHRLRLIDMIQRWGFHSWGRKAGGEDVYIRSMRKSTLSVPRLTYPFQNGNSDAFIVTVGKGFSKLLIPTQGIRENSSDVEPFRNAIRKMIILDDDGMRITPGSAILFFHKDIFNDTEGIIGAGIIDDVFSGFSSEEEFIMKCRKRTILPLESLHNHWIAERGRLKVVYFLHNASFYKKPIQLKTMTDTGINVALLKSTRCIALNKNQFRGLIKGTEYEETIVAY